MFCEQVVGIPSRHLNRLFLEDINTPFPKPAESKLEQDVTFCKYLLHCCAA